ncbi:type IV secretion system protein [Helicobacter baculiformis]|uniref:Type IV secretion system protein n=1 Tax=Helicobacter baculiformis TaxID=427351 RepID=A0ABV7ZHD9_9HELI|nr:type IV secretion system protein [Helicobacter baculiformis]
MGDKYPAGSFFAKVINFFQGPAENVVSDLATQMTELFRVQMSLNIILSILFMVWAYKRVKEGDLFQFKTLMGVGVFVVFVGIINWAISEPATYIREIKNIIYIPAEALTDIIDKSMRAFFNAEFENISKGEHTSIANLIDRSYYGITLFYSAVFKELGWKMFFTMLPQLVLFFLLVVAQVLFIALVLIIVLMVFVETKIWLALGIVVLPLGLFPQTKGMLFSYIKKLLSLTFYKPCLMLVAFFNFNIIKETTKKIPSQTEIKQEFFGDPSKLLQNGVAAVNGVLDSVGLLGHLVLLILSSLVCFYLVKRIPDFINGIFNTSGGVGAITEMMQKIGMTAGGVVVGGSAVTAANKITQAYQSAGGGLAGVRAGLGALGTMGATGGVSAVADRESISAGVKFGVHTIKNALGSGFATGSNTGNQYNPPNNTPNTGKGNWENQKGGG